MTPDALLAMRLRNQKLTATTLRRPGDVVAWLGAVQAQDFSTAKWGLALRARGLDEAAIDRAFDAGAMLRTHILRPTWHFVAPRDIRWIQSLTAPRVHQATASYVRAAELDPATLAKSRRVLERSLRDANYLTRAEVAAALARAGIAARGQPLAYVMMHAELEQVICSGPRRGKQFTYALLDERAPALAPLPRDEALARLARRYFTSHGPATARDFAWWSGLTLADAKRGIAMARPALASARREGLEYWFARSSAVAPPAARTALLLPNYDEYLIAYQDRDLVRGTAWPAFRPPAGGWANYLVLGGRLAGSWRRTFDGQNVRVTITPSVPVSKAFRRALAARVAAFGRYCGRARTVAARNVTHLKFAKGDIS